MKTHRRHIVVGLVLLVLFILMVIVVRHWGKLLSVFRVVFFAMMISYILLPASEWLERFMPRHVAIIVLFSSLLLMLGAIAFLIIPPFVRQVVSLSEYIPEYAHRLKQLVAEIQLRLKRMGLPYSVQQALEETIEDIQRRLIGVTRDTIEGFMNGASGISELLMIPVLSFYFLKDRKYFKKLMVNVIPSRYRKGVTRTFSEVHYILNRFIRSQVIISLVIGVFTTLGFLVLRIPYALTLGIVAGIFEIIPYFGPWLGAVPAVVITALNAPSKIVWAIAVMIAVQQLEGSFITPKIMGDHVGLHPVYIILSLWIGGIFYGIMGMLLAVPVVLIIRVIIKNVYLSIVTISH
ncbi:putative PurR-regulated permease PerM [Caldicoprobacter guelmensis]|uniref:AI-2E family transporter n=1 Tax=Caldicoprobacter guelmensis TaxID=1170224 RepID=UPI00195DBAC9|nr:putative PurR-regulated permease PerM [Caldicoprobacter guelmensis]